MREKQGRNVWKTRWFSALVSAFFVVVAGFVTQATGAERETPRLQISVTIPGVTDTLPEGVIMADSFSWGMAETSSAPTGGGSVKVSEFVIRRTVDMASPSFFRNCVSGAHYKTVTLEMRKAGGDPKSAGQLFLRYVLTNVVVSSLQNSGNPGSEGPTETISFAYGQIAVEYTQQTEELDCSQYPVCTAAESR